jgi:hypothetical protein
MTRRRARAGLRDRWLPYIFAIGAHDCEVGSLLHAMYLRTSETGYIAPLSHEEYGKLLGCSANAVSQRVSQARHKWHAIDLRRAAFPGHPAEYEALIPSGMVVTAMTTIAVEQDPSHDNHSSEICPTCGGEWLSQLGQPIARASVDVTNTTNGKREASATCDTVTLAAYGCER